MLADYGATVVQVAPVTRNAGLQTRPVYHTYAAGRGWQRIHIDLKAEAGRETLLRLVDGADVLIESYRPGAAARLGLGWDVVRRRNPRLVYCSTSGYGQDGPAADWAGHDLNYLAMSGYLACSEPRADGGPAIPGATIADGAGGGMHAVMAILAALVKRGATGHGAYLDVAAAEGALSLMSLSIDQYLAEGEVAGPRAVLLTGRYACYDLYQAGDGRWLSVAAIEPRFYRNLCERLGLPEWSAHQYDDGRQDEIREAFRRTFRAQPRDVWIERLAAHDTCVAPVLTIPELVDAPHWRARRTFASAEHPERGAFRQLGPVLAGMRRDGPPHHVRADDETDVRSLLADAGMADDEISRLIDEGTVE
jgi:alpha-methylacyl-CoA racemase